MIRTVLHSTWLLFCALTFINCSDAETAIDCAGICERYQECVEDDYDVSACTDRCEQEAENDRDFRDDTNVCNTCIEDRSCADAFLSCATDCVGIVP
jgi:hypothetical protein